MRISFHCCRVHAPIWGFNALTPQHVVVCIICDGVDVWGRLRAAFALVGGDHLGRVDRQPFVGIHRHAEQPRVGLRKPGSVKKGLSASRNASWRRTHIDHPGRVASAQVVQDGRLVEVRQHGHVLHQVILGRVHLLDVTILYRQSLNTRGNISLQMPTVPRPSEERSPTLPSLVSTMTLSPLSSLIAISM